MKGIYRNYNGREFPVKIISKNEKTREYGGHSVKSVEVTIDFGEPVTPTHPSTTLELTGYPDLDNPNFIKFFGSCSDSGYRHFLTVCS